MNRMGLRKIGPVLIIFILGGESLFGYGKSTFACFVDFKKAFDCVNRDLLLFK